MKAAQLQKLVAQCSTLGARRTLRSAASAPLSSRTFVLSQRPVYLFTQPANLVPTARRLSREAVRSLGTATTDMEALTDQAAGLKIEANGAESLTAAMQRRTSMAAILEADDQGLSQVGHTLIVGGWVRTGREQGAGAEEPWAFVELSDGSTFGSLQVIIFKSVAEAVGGLKAVTPTGASILVEGKLVKAPENAKQVVELKAERIIYHGACDASKYPLAKKKQSYEFLREIGHLRARTNTISAVARIRNALAQATHMFFQSKGFLYVHSPIITASDAEGAGEMFQVTTLLSKVEELGAIPKLSDDQLADLGSQVTAQGETVKAAKAAAKEAKDDKALAAKAKAEVDTLLKLKQQLEDAQKGALIDGGLPRLPTGKVDYSHDYFDRPAYLTVSGQLNAEYFACGLSKVYTFGPTFRAENSHTTRHLAEFWMIEPEIAFCDLEMDMSWAEQYVQFCCKFLLEKCMPDLEFIVSRIDKGAIERLQAVASTPFRRLSYTEAVQVLEDAIKNKKKKFQFPVSWGADLQSEHERYLTEEVYKQPVIVYNYPKEIKAFYMRLNDDGKTVAAMDVLVPGVGELVGGSQREERLEVLERRIKEAGMPQEPYEGYLDLRRYGTVPHAGFGLGFERLILFATGIDNIREVIPFPRWPGHAEF